MKTQRSSSTNSLKTFGLILTLCAMPILWGMTGCTTGNRYQRSTGEKVDDDNLSSDVKSALNKESLYKYNSVYVVTFQSVVRLSGFVDNLEQVNHAGMVAYRVQGVLEVQNNIMSKE
jgi:osmotically-inducible protein OsmY